MRNDNNENVKKPNNHMRGVYQRKSGNWAIHYFYNGREYREVVGSSKKLALDVLSKRRTLIAENKHFDVKRVKEVITFADFAEKYMETHSKPNKRSWRSSDENSLNHLKPYFGGCYLNEITPEKIEAYKIQRQQQVSVASVNRELSCLRGMFSRAIDWSYAQENPVKKVKFFKENNIRVRYLEKEERARLLMNCSAKLRPVVLVALNTGMRKGEVRNLKWGHVDFNRGFVTLQDTKNGEKRIIPLNKEAKDALLSIRKHPESSYIFCGNSGQPYSFQTAFNSAVKKTGLIDFHFHDCRHDFASQLAMRGVDLNTIRELLGHKSLSMTQRYAHLSQDHKSRAVQVLENNNSTATVPRQENHKELANLKNFDKIISSLAKAS